jgi:hypothetical protein
MTPVVAVAGVIVTVAWFGWQCHRAVKSAARPSPHGGLERRRRGSGDGSSLPVPAPGELRTFPCPECGRPIDSIDEERITRHGEEHGIEKLRQIGIET